MHSLLRAIEICGSQSALAKRITEELPEGEVVTSQQIWNWLNRDKAVPERYCPTIEKVCAGQVTRRDLRPDDWDRIWPELAQTGRRSTDKNQ